MAHYVLLNPFHGGLGGGVGHGRASLVSTLGVSAVWCFGANRGIPPMAGVCPEDPRSLALNALALRQADRGLHGNP